MDDDEGSPEDPRMRTLVASLLATEMWLEERGWDMPPMVLTLEAVDTDPVTDDGTGAEALTYRIIGTGDPYEILDGLDASDAQAVLVAFEMWAWPPDLPETEQVGRPSEHPDRIEIRSLVARTRDHETMSVIRVRGEKPYMTRDVEGPLYDALDAAAHPSDRADVE